MMKRVTRRDFLRYSGVASSALTFSPFFLERLTAMAAATPPLTRVYKVMNGADCFQSIAKLWQMLDGPATYIGPTDVVVIKGNAQWPNQGYTHTGCIKAVIDQILQIPGFSGEIIISDNTTTGGGPGASGFDATVVNRTNNWPNHNWNSLAAEYQANGKPVSAKRLTQGPWRNVTLPLPAFSPWNPADGEGWGRSFFTYNSRPTFLSYPVFQSPLTSGRMIDMKNGVWENGGYTARKIKTIFMPTLNNHGQGYEDYAGVTSAIKSFFGATEIPLGQDAVWNGYYHIHSASYSQGSARYAGELVGRYINSMYSPVLYITAAMYSGWYSRTETYGAAATNTVLACTNPVTLDYVACRDVISKVGSPRPTWLDPSTQNNNTWLQLSGCNSQGIGTLNPAMYEIVTYDFNHPTTTQLEIDRKVRDYKAGTATQQDVKDAVSQYMQGQ